MARTKRFERLMAEAGRDLPVARAVVGVIGTGMALTRELGESLAPADLSTQQFMVLMELAASPDGMLPLTTLGARAQSSAPNMSALISRMQAAGLVAKVRGVDDQRVVNVQITEDGWKRLQIGAPLVIAAEKRLANKLSRRELGELVSILHKLG